MADHLKKAIQVLYHINADEYNSKCIRELDALRQTLDQKERQLSAIQPINEGTAAIIHSCREAIKNNIAGIRSSTQITDFTLEHRAMAVQSIFITITSLSHTPIAACNQNEQAVQYISSKRPAEVKN